MILFQFYLVKFYKQNFNYQVIYFLDFDVYDFFVQIGFVIFDFFLIYFESYLVNSI